MVPKRNVIIAAIFLLLALLPVAAAMSVPPRADHPWRGALIQPLTAVRASLQPSLPAEMPSDLGVITAVGASLLGLAAVVRKATGA